MDPFLNVTDNYNPTVYHLQFIENITSGKTSKGHLFLRETAPTPVAHYKMCHN